MPGNARKRAGCLIAAAATLTLLAACDDADAPSKRGPTSAGTAHPTAVPVKPAEVKYRADGPNRVTIVVWSGQYTRISNLKVVAATRTELRLSLMLESYRQPTSGGIAAIAARVWAPLSLPASVDWPTARVLVNDQPIGQARSTDTDFSSPAKTAVAGVDDIE